MLIRSFASSFSALALLSIVACSSETRTQAPTGDYSYASEFAGDPGALVRVTASSRVGVLLDELPASIRDRTAKTLIEKPESYWLERAKNQLELTTYRLVFRSTYYPKKPRAQLQLPDRSVWNIAFNDPAGKKAAARRETINGHDYVVVDYQFDTALLAEKASVVRSEPNLGRVGGYWEEPFSFPIDPELIVQRTGYACMDEAQFPPNSVDTEDVIFFYDQDCDVEEAPTPTGCHQHMPLPTLSCLDALDQFVGRVDTKVLFRRIEWDAKLADQVRVGEVTNPNGADLAVVKSELEVNRVTYRYIPEDSCAIAEKCVNAPGWRRLLQFNASEQNTGVDPVHLGDVDYFIANPDAPTELSSHNIFEFSACHGHYHFSHYGQFHYGAQDGGKRAFCLESTNRYSNNESSPLDSPYYDCAYQGIQAGWGDQYNAGIECQWIDVTDVAAPSTHDLKFQSNPDAFLCEGDPVYTRAGDLAFEPTEFKTATGAPVDRPKCDFFSENWANNNEQAVPVTLPKAGEGLITSECTRGQIGPRRNCGFKANSTLESCAPGQLVTRTCSVPSGSAPQVARWCEASKVLNAGMACAESDALANVTIEEAAPLTTTFPCPDKRSDAEPGGSYAIYTGVSFPGDAEGVVTCQ